MWRPRVTAQFPLPLNPAMRQTAENNAHASAASAIMTSKILYWLLLLWTLRIILATILCGVDVSRFVGQRCAAGTSNLAHERTHATFTVLKP